MPDFMLTDPGGQRFKLTVPDGVSEQDIQALIAGQGLPGEPQPRSRGDILSEGAGQLKEALAPSYLKDTPPTPESDLALADPAGKPRKIGPPSGPSTLAEIAAGMGADIAGGKALELAGLMLAPMPGRAAVDVGLGRMKQFFNIFNDEGRVVGWTELTHDPRHKTVNVEMIQSSTPREGGKAGSLGYAMHPDAHTLGPREMRTLLPEVKKMYPDAEKVGGYRVSGARNVSGHLGYTSLPLPDTAGQPSALSAGGPMTSLEAGGGAMSLR